MNQHFENKTLEYDAEMYSWDLWVLDELKKEFPHISSLENIHNEIDASSLMEKAKTFFKRNGLLLNWREFDKLDPTQKINTLAMIAPVTNEEKQKLLGAVSIENKIDTLESIISFYLHETGLNNQTIQ